MTTLGDFGHGSLRQAITEANSQGGGTIIFSNVTGVITLASELPQVAASTSILGPGTNVLTISGSNQFRVFSFGQGTTSTVAGLKISDGRLTNGTHGAGILNLGVLTISNCSLLNNQTLGGRGGAIHSSGNLTVQHSLISSNRAAGKDGRGTGFPPGTGAGGGISIESGKATILGSSVSLNVATGGKGDYPGKGGDATGGGVFVADGEVTILKCSLDFNSARGGLGGYAVLPGIPATPGGVGRGGAVFVAGDKVEVADSILMANSSTGGPGGSSGVSGGDAFGAGIHVESGLVEITGVTLSGNRCEGGDGASSDRSSGGYGGFGRGGGLSADGGVVNVVNSTVSGNQARGGDGGDGAPFRGPAGGPGVGGRGGDGVGGGIFAGGGDIRLVNCTLARNQASWGFSGFTAGISGFTNGSYDLAQYGTGSGGGAASAGTIPKLRNSILAANLADAGPDGYGTFVSDGHNLIGKDDGMTINSVFATDLRNLDPLLGPLHDNGGQTPTHALATNSAAIDAGSNLGAPAFDQRGNPRPQGAGVDIGAFEYATRPTGPTPVIQATSLSRAVLAGTDVFLSVSVSGSMPFASQWARNGVPILGATNSTLNLMDVRLTDSGSYRVTVSDAQNVATSGEIILEVKLSLVDPSFEWARSSSTTSSGHARDIAADSGGNLCIAGSFGFKIQFDGTSLTSTGSSSDIFVARFDRQGRNFWIQRAGGPDFDAANAISSDTAGNAYLTGVFRQTATFGSESVTSAGGNDIFVAKFSNTGSVSWVRQAGGREYEEGYGIAVDASGSSIVTGSFDGTATFGNQKVLSLGGSDVFVANYDPQGTIQWVRQAGGTNFDRGIDIALDASGNSYVVGIFNGTALFDSTSLTHPSGNGAFLASYDSSGHLRWAKQSARPQDIVSINAVAADGPGNCFVAGNLIGAALFEDGTFVDNGVRNAFVAKYRSNGALVWSHVVAASSTALWTDVTTDRMGACYVAGVFDVSVDLPVALNVLGDRDVVTAKLSSDGVLRWVTVGGGSSWDSSTGIAVNSFGEVFVAGHFGRFAVFDPHTVNGSPSGDSVFLAKVALQPRLAAVTDSFGASQPFRLLLDGEANVPYVIEKSESLSTWSALLIVTNLVGRTEILDSSSTNLGHRFYRAVKAP